MTENNAQQATSELNAGLGGVAHLLMRLEEDYQFECEAGPLKNCVEWQALKSEIRMAFEREREKCCKAFRHLDWGRWDLDEIRTVVANHLND